MALYPLNFSLEAGFQPTTEPPIAHPTDITTLGSGWPDCLVHSDRRQRVERTDYSIPGASAVRKPSGQRDSLTG